MNEEQSSPESLESLKVNIMPTMEARDENYSAKERVVDEDRQLPSLSAFYEQSKRGATLAEVGVNKTKVTALIVSGATRSIAPMSLANSLSLTIVPPVNGRKWLLADNSSTLGVIGTARVTVKISASQIPHKLVFTETLAYDLIVGVDVLMVPRLQIRLRKRSLGGTRVRG